jgi:hypothetical protein
LKISSDDAVKPSGPTQLYEGLKEFVTVKLMLPLESPQLAGVELTAITGSFSITII